MHNLGIAWPPVSESEAPFLLFSGSANLDLAQSVANSLGMPLGERGVERFPDGELHIQVRDSVRGRDAYIIQPTCPPVNENLMELFIMLDTLRRANAARVTAIIPYYGYSRQDRKSAGREPITAKLVANLIAESGASRVLCIDLHSPAIQGFFEIGMDHLTAVHTIAGHCRHLNLQDAVIVSPDTGGVKRADTYANLLNLPLAILHKRREDANNVEIAAVIGDVKDKRPIIADDIIATGGTLRRAADALLNAGALPDITVVATHAVLAGNAVDQLNHPAIQRVIVSDSIPIALEKRRRLPTLQIVSLGPLLAQAIVRLHRGQSLSELYQRTEHDVPTLPWSV
jgi:ribose-phosphate pyrophosphokinase